MTTLLKCKVFLNKLIFVVFPKKKLTCSFIIDYHLSLFLNYYTFYYYLENFCRTTVRNKSGGEVLILISNFTNSFIHTHKTDEEGHDAEP